jgi:hypothetical protein
MPEAITCDEALWIARLEAEAAYGDLTASRITLTRKADGWHVDYDLTEEQMAGGGPPYVIEPTTGAIISKVQEQ